MSDKLREALEEIRSMKPREMGQTANEYHMRQIADASLGEDYPPPNAAMIQMRKEYVAATSKRRVSINCDDAPVTVSYEVEE